MKVNKEDIDKLSQLDRIEYRQKYSVNHSKTIGAMLVFIFCGIAALSFMIVSIIYEVTGDLLSRGLYSIGAILFFILAIITILSKGNKIDEDQLEIDEEYFKIEIKKKK